jgi:iron complex transport system substrate-binding protein
MTANFKTISVLWRLIFSLVIATIVSCGSSESSIQTRGADTKAGLTVTDGTNVEVALEKPAERIICLDITCTDILAELDIEPIAVVKGMEAWVREPHLFGERAKEFALIGAAGLLDPNLEQIVQLQPDLVIGIAAHQKSREALKGAVSFYLLNLPNSYTEAIANLKSVGKLTGKTAEAEAAAQRFLDKLAAYKAKSPNNQTVLLIHRPQPNFLVATDRALNCATLNEVANCLSPEKEDTITFIGYLPFSLERLVQLDPDVIFISSGARDNYAEFIDYYEDNPLWDSLRAVKNRRVYGASASRLFAPGTRGLGRLLDKTMPKIYPDVFPESES